MNRNTITRFNEARSDVHIKRSRFDRASSHKTTFNVGKLIPFYVDEVLPGDTVQIDTAKVVRMQPMVSPPMDDLYLDTYYFFVPNRLVWENWQRFQGESDSAWTPVYPYSVPQVSFPAGGWSKGTIADYMGVPTGVTPLKVDGANPDSINALPFRAFCKIYNDWFRSENLEDAVYFPMDNTTAAGSNGSTIISDMYKGGECPTVHKFHDYFTSCLPAPQKAADVMLPAITFPDTPVYALGNVHPPTGSQYSSEGDLYYGDWYPLAFKAAYNDNALQGFHKGAFTFLESAEDEGLVFKNEYGLLANSAAEGQVPNYPDDAGDYDTSYFAAPVNLWAKIAPVSPWSINQLRLAFQLQKAYEIDARCGSRYVEALKARWGVTSPDYRLQRSEYLGGNRITIQVNQVLQTSSTDATSPQGNPTGISVTHDNHSDFTKSFTEHGFLIGCMVARYNHTYQQGLERFWSRKDRFDYYEPVFANIGEQPVLKKEIYLGATNATNNAVFGYQEAWADYRFKPSRVSGEMRSNLATSLDNWHYADDYTGAPTLSAAWLREDKSNVDRVLAIQSSVSDQLFADIYIKNYTTRAMPVFSVPGLIDHA